MTIKNTYPTIRPTIGANFSRSKKLDSRINFTRTSSGTYIDSNGVIKTVRLNEPRFDHHPTTGESLGLLIEEQRINFLRESYPSAFTQDYWLHRNLYTTNNAVRGPGIRGIDITPRSTTYSAVYFSLSWAGIETTVTYTNWTSPGISIVPYRVSFLINPLTWTGAIFLQSQTYDGNPAFGTRITLFNNGVYTADSSFIKSIYSDGTYWLHNIFKPGNTGTSFRLGFTVDSLGNDSRKYWVSGIQMESGPQSNPAGTTPDPLISTSFIPALPSFTSRASTATYYNSSGYITTAAVNEGRINAYFPDNNGKMYPGNLLLENSSTNYHRYSTNFANWTANLATSTLTLTAETLDPSGGSGAYVLYGNMQRNAEPGPGSGASFPFRGSIFVKKHPSGTNLFNLYLTAAGGDSGVTINFDTETVSASGQTPQNPTIQKLPNGWYRIGLTITPGSTNWRPVLGTTPASNTYWYVYGVQIESSLIETSYIPTSGSAVTRSADVSSSSNFTRAADVASISTSNILNTTKSSILVESSNSLNNRPAFSLNNGTAFNESKVLVYPTAGGAKISTNGNIATNGLVLNLDAGNPASYPGSGTTWTDLSGLGNTGTLVNGVGYNSGNGGSLSFDGVNDVVTGSITPLTSNYSIELWFKLITSNSSDNSLDRKSVV
jgi:hypothetical protein